MNNNNSMEQNENRATSARSGRVLDFIAKILCPVIAFFLWFYAMSTDVVTLERDFTVPVQFENEAALTEKTGWSVLSGKDSKIVVTIKGKRNIVNKITEDDIFAFADVSGVESPGRQVLDIKTSAPSECEIINVSASSVSPFIDKKVTKTVPVKVSVSDYVISSELKHDDPTANYVEVSVTGPESEIHRIYEARADLSLGNMSLVQTINSSCSMKLYDEKGDVVSSNYITMSTRTVNVTVRVYAEKEIPLTVDYKHGYFNTKNVNVTILPGSIKLRGEPSLISKLDKINIATLDEKMYTENSSQKVSIAIPDGFTIVSGEETAEIRVEHIGTTTKQLTVKNIIVANSGGLNCELQTKTLNVTVRGSANLLKQITEENITVTADMKNYSTGSGITVVPATINFSAEYENTVYELGNYNVTVNIK
ncbi:MAG: hypothetical protein E7593_03285 [Ruminococcaceae bacterium]|nr:hypothetical protein [Oscillospiraceae bacterium]